MIRYTKKEINFIKNNFNKMSRVEMSLKLNRTIGSIRSVLNRFSLKNSKKDILNKQILFNRKISGEFTVDERLFTSKINKTTSYLLGLLWADGCLVIKRKFGDIKTCRIILSLKKDDGGYIKNLLNKTGKWSFYINNAGKNSQYVFSCSNTILCQFLEKNDYIKKSIKSPTKILNFIPIKYHNYFYLGYLDGDGCIYAKNNDFRIIFTSNIKQDWSFLKSLCKQLGCKFTIQRIIRKNRNSKFSSFSLFGKSNCLLLCNFIYSNNKKLGFDRKREKYKLIQNYTSL
jgi:hypothetical protein